MEGDVDIGRAAALIAEPARAAILTALADADALSAGELARWAGVAPATASGHLARLEAGGLVLVERHGRYRYYRLAGRHVAAALEALALIAPAQRVRSLREADRGAALRAARTCYDHLAGSLGVALADTFLTTGVLELADGAYVVTEKGDERFKQLGVSVAALRSRRRPLARPCLDWSERRFHLAGALGAALLENFFRLGWLRRTNGRAVRVTAQGRAGFRELGVDV